MKKSYIFGQMDLNMKKYTTSNLVPQISHAIAKDARNLALG